MDATHPLALEPGEVVVHGDEVDALALERVQVVVVALADDPLGRLARDGEGLDREIVDRFAVRDALAELGGLGLQLGVTEPLHRRFEGVDVGHHALQRLQLLPLAGAKDAFEDAHAVVEPTGTAKSGVGVARA